MTVPVCDFCGDPIDGPVHNPHDRSCDADFCGENESNCDCDNQTCALDCWTCNQEGVSS